MNKFIFLIILAIAGCSTVPRVSVQQQINEVYQDCGKLYEAESKSSVADCMARNVLPVFQRAGYPHMDLVNLLYAHLAADVRLLEEGKISAAELKTRIAELEVRIRTEEQRRNAMAAQLDAQNRANALMLYQMFQPRQPITCIRVGIATQCY